MSRQKTCQRQEAHLNTSLHSTCIYQPMKKYFWMSGERLLYRAFYRYGLISPLDSQHPAPRALAQPLSLVDFTRVVRPCQCPPQTPRGTMALRWVTEEVLILMNFHLQNDTCNAWLLTGSEDGSYFTNINFLRVQITIVVLFWKWPPPIGGLTAGRCSPREMSNPQHPQMAWPQWWIPERVTESLFPWLSTLTVHNPHLLLLCYNADSQAWVLHLEEVTSTYIYLHLWQTCYEGNSSESWETL